MHCGCRLLLPKERNQLIAHQSCNVPRYRCCCRITPHHPCGLAPSQDDQTRHYSTPVTDCVGRLACRFDTPRCKVSERRHHANGPPPCAFVEPRSKSLAGLTGLCAESTGKDMQMATDCHWSAVRTWDARCVWTARRLQPPACPKCHTAQDESGRANSERTTRLAVHTQFEEETKARENKTKLALSTSPFI